MDIMQAILDIEEKARGISDSAKDMQAHFEEELAAETQKRKEEAEKQVKEQLRQIRLRMDAEREEDMEQLERFYEKKMEALAEQSKAKKQEWIDEITKNILSV